MQTYGAEAGPPKGRQTAFMLDRLHRRELDAPRIELKRVICISRARIELTKGLLKTARYQSLAHHTHLESPPSIFCFILNVIPSSNAFKEPLQSLPVHRRLIAARCTPRIPDSRGVGIHTLLHPKMPKTKTLNASTNTGAY
jgi:hypothetical protein